MPEWISAIAAVVAAVFAVAAWIVARRAGRDSKRSADASEKSANTSADAAETARIEAARRVEPRDVDWEFVDQPEGEHWRIEYRNKGTTVAHTVEAALSIDGNRVNVAPGEVPPDQTFTYDAHEAYAESERRWRHMLDAGFIGSPGISVTARIVWTSQLGTPGVWSGENNA